MTRLIRPSRALLLALPLLAAACSVARNADTANQGACTTCHGGTLDQTGAPPRDLHGGTDPALVGVGAHARHLAAGVACSSCHVVPTRFGTPGHGDGRVQVTFAGQAVMGGASPSWDRATATCSNVYCHGATFTGASVGASPAPVWNGGALAGGACGGCHAAKPRGHGAFAPTDCAQCHPGTVDASGALVRGGQHLDGQRQVSLSTCTGCHGGTDNGSGAPPRDLAGSTDTSAVTVGAHTAHLAAGLTCAACHPAPDPASPASHIDGGTAQLAWGPLATTGGASPAWSRAGATCSNVYCHGAFQGGNAGAPVWTSVGAGQAACGTCHGRTGAEFPGAPASNHPTLAAGSGPAVCNACHAGAVDAAGRPVAPGQHLDGQVQVDPFSKHPAGFAGTPHQLAATGDVARCLGCHAAKAPARVTQVVCAGCHDGLAGGSDWTTTCNTCHGSAQTAAPPPWNTPNHDPGAGGAHLAHVLSANGVAAPLGCEFCHQRPATVLSAGHLDGAIHVTGYTGTDAAWSAAGGDPGWSAGSATCATAYCHGAFPGGNATNVPVWTSVGQGQGACGTCHALPPPAPHPALPSSGLDACATCHPDTVTAAGALVPAASGGKHLDGLVEVSGGHQPSWMDQASPGFHAVSAVAGLGACTPCHGATLDGGFARVACADCHGAGWRTDCTMCHGGTDDQTGAPPKATWRRDGDPVRTGAHGAHVRGGFINPGGFACAVCHATPADVFSPGHIDGPTASVTFTGLALPAAAWDRGTATCTVYCHGTTVAGGTLKTPSWTAVGHGQASCGACHGVPPPSPHPVVTGGFGTCSVCHPDSMDGSGALIPRAAGGKHLDGEVQFVSGHGPDWLDQSKPGFHGGAVYDSLSSCQACHGATLDGGGNAALACDRCHGPGWRTDCTMCHGGTDNATGAPPRATFLRRADPVPVGAHTAHVGLGAAATTRAGLAQPIGCESCHAVPASALSTGHLDGAAAVTAYTGALLAKQATMVDPGWSAGSATCATSYCHGATLQGGTRTVPTWTAATGTQAQCGACHALPPASGPLSAASTPAHLLSNHLQAHCERCHDGFTASTVNAALHVNGTRDVSIASSAPNPDPPFPTPPTLDACNNLVPIKRTIGGWDCATCHRYREYAYNRCCIDQDAPNPAWCSQ